MDKDEDEKMILERHFAEQQQGTYVLNEIIRFLCAATSYSSAECSRLWLSRIRTYEIDNSVSLLQFLLFTLDNTLNTELLDRTATLLLNITYFDSLASLQLVEQHEAVKSYVRTLREALYQDNDDAMDCMLRILEVISSRYDGDKIMVLFARVAEEDTDETFSLLDVLREMLEKGPELSENVMVCLN
jgi:hypothetical protein